VLGIGADDIFVFIDAWRQSDKIDPNILSDRKKRLAYSFRRAVRAMAVTSSTTSVAFFANFFSPLMPIRSFGIFAGIIVPVNYLLIVMLFPPATILYENYFEGRTCCCTKKKTDETTLAESEENGNAKIERFFGTKWNETVFKYRYLIITLTCAYTIFSIIKASQIGPLTKQEAFVADDNPVMIP